MKNSLTTWRSFAMALACAVSMTGCGGGGGGGGSPTQTGGDSPTGPATGPTAAVPPAVPFAARANDVVWDAQRQVLYLSLPSSAGPSGNTIVALDPTTNKVVRSQFAGSEPNVLSMSDDGQYLYAGIDGSANIQRFKLPELTPDLTIPLGRDDVSGAFHAVDLAAVPGSPRSVIVGLSAYVLLDFVQKTAVFDDAISRVQTVTNCLCSSFQWGANGQLYAGNNEGSTFDSYSLQADSSGLHLTGAVSDVYSGFGSRIHYSFDTRLSYADDGTVFDPTAGARVTKTKLRGAMVADTARNRLIYATMTGTAAIEALDATTYESIGTPVTYAQTIGYPARMVRWGSQGLALTTGEGSVMLFGGSGASSFSTSIPAGTARRTVLPGTVNRIVWNAATARIYATLSQASPTLAGQVVVIDPVTSQITRSTYLGSEPDAVAVSDDGQYLYVGLDEIGIVQRLRLPDLTPDATLSLGAHAQFGTYTAGNIQVAPGNARTVAISRFSPAVVPTEQGGIVVFDDAVARPVSATRAQSPLATYGEVVWGADSTTLYWSSLTGADLYVLAVDASGIRIARTIRGAFESPGHLHRGIGNNLLYHDTGRVLDTSTGLPVGRYRSGDNSNGAEWVTSDATANRVFTAASLVPASGSPLAYRIDAFDMSRFTPVVRYSLDTAPGFPFDFTQAGPGAFAFRSVEGVSIVKLQ